MIQTVDNFISENFIFENKVKIINDNYYFKYSKANDIQDINITFGDYKKNSNNQVFNFSDNEGNEKDLVLSISSYQKENRTFYFCRTGNYIGTFTYQNRQIDIQSRLSNTFLKRMLNFTNDVYLDDVDISGEIAKKENFDYSKFIIFYMFVQKIEKAFLLGLPKSYVTIRHHEMKLKGRIDINRFIKHDIPFKGKISSVSREQKESQEIIDVLYRAISIIEKEMPSFLKNILHIKTHLKQYRSKHYVSKNTIQKALRAKALQNPIFSPYKKIIEYAQLIINNRNIKQKKDARNTSKGFLIDVSELFELYLVKLLRWKMPEWNVEHEPEIPLYENQFYSRGIRPDIVLTRDHQVMVFDAKYKRMMFAKGGGDGGYGDLDRSDFFQIHTYMSYYQNQKDTALIAGGLLYPMDGEFKDKNCHSDHWLGNEETKFVVDGIDLSSIECGITDMMSEEEKNKKRMENILLAENTFIARMRNISENIE